MRRTSLTPMTALEEEHRRMSLKPLVSLTPVQETQGKALGNNHVKPVKSATNKLEPKTRRTSRAITTMRRDFYINRKYNSGDGPDTLDPEEILDDEVLLSRLQRMFIAAEEDEKTGLDIDEFKEAMQKTVGRNNTQEEIEILFMKVDANCDGVVDWEEFVTYNLLEYKEKTLMMEMLREKPFPNDIREIDSRHRDIIVKIIFYPNVRKSGAVSSKICYKSGKYVTLSKEGVIGLWSLSMRNLKYYNANQYQNRKTQSWFTDMVAMHNVNMLALTSTDRDITIFDLTGKKFTMRYYLTGFESCITAMDYWVNPNDMNFAILIFGDTAGSVSSMRFDSVLRGGPFGATSAKKNTCKRVSFPEIMKGFVLGVKAYKMSNIHEDWVNKVLYLPEIDSFLSSCQCPQTALFFGDFAGKKKRMYFKVNKGVLSFDYSHSLNIIVTGGMDYMLRVWNPYVNNKCIVLLKGHTKPVNHVVINGTRHQVISIDKGRSIRVFDLRDQACLQHISGRMIKCEPFPITAVFYNAATRTLLIAANQIVMLEKREEEEGFSETVSHNKPIVAAMYSKVFGSVVSACQESVVSIWDTNSGVKMMQFVNAHSRIERGVMVPVEITALCFDQNGRRLVTGARNGTVHVWNFNNGSLMQNFSLPDSSDVTGLVCTQHSIYVSGWGKMVYIYVDGSGEEHRKNWKMQHKEDILSIADMPPNMMVTGSYDGEIIIWSRETGQVNCRLNACISVKPITEGGQARRHGSVKEQNVIPTTQSGTFDQVESTHKWLKGKAKLSRAGLLFSKKSGEFAKQDSSDEEDECKHPLLPALHPDSFNCEGDSQFSRNEYDGVCKSYESAVEKIIFLDTREPSHKETANIVTSGAEGWIRFWSIHHEGGLLGQFNAAHRLGESVFTIKSDTEDNYLFTGDTEGYVKIWDIRDYCKSKKMNSAERKAHYEFLRRKFTFFRAECHQESKQLYTVPSYLKNVFASRPPPESSNPKRTLKYPMLVNSFRAHMRSINSVDYVTDRELLITGSADCSIRIWTVNGQFIGTFGGEKWPTLPNIVTNEYFLSQIPKDIRRAGSARTLKVMHGGKLPMWQSAISILKHRGVERLKKQFGHLQEVASQVLDKRESNEVSSNILGKSYKKQMNHRMPPTLPKFIETPGKVAVYHTLPFVELTPIDPFTDTIKEIQTRRAGNLAMNKLRGLNPRKPDTPAILQVFNQLVKKQGSPIQKYKLGNRLKKVADRYQSPISARGRRRKDSRSASKASSSKSQPETKVVESRDGSRAETKVVESRDGSRAETKVVESRDGSRTDLSESLEEDENACDKLGSSTLSCGSPGNGSRADVKLPSIVE